jgi:hypothetical protein
MTRETVGTECGQAPLRRRPIRGSLCVVSKGVVHRGPVVAATLVAIQSLACAPSQPAAEPAPAHSEAPPAPSAPQSMPVDTGKDCAKATARCGGGACDVTVTNDCGDPVRCAFELAASCQTQSGAITVTGADRGLVGAHSTSDLAAQTSCPEGPASHTEVSKLVCK